MNPTPHPSPLPLKGEGVKSCAHCGAVIVNATVLEAQYFCDINCVAAWIRGKTKQWRTTMKKECAQCGQPMQPRENESRAAFARRITCSHSCVALYGQYGVHTKAQVKIKVPDFKVCANCVKAFERRKYAGGQAETATAFAKRRFCSQRCAAEARWREKRNEKGTTQYERKLEANREHRAKKVKEKREAVLKPVTAKPTVTVAEVMAKRQEMSRYTPVTESVGTPCKCGRGNTNPYTGLCPTCYLTRQRKEKAKARVGYE